MKAKPFILHYVAASGVPVYECYCSYRENIYSVPIKPPCPFSHFINPHDEDEKCEYCHDQQCLNPAARAAAQAISHDESTDADRCLLNANRKLRRQLLNKHAENKRLRETLRRMVGEAEAVDRA